MRWVGGLLVAADIEAKINDLESRINYRQEQVERITVHMNKERGQLHQLREQRFKEQEKERRLQNELVIEQLKAEGKTDEDGKDKLYAHMAENDRPQRVSLDMLFGPINLFHADGVRGFISKGDPNKQGFHDEPGSTFLDTSTGKRYVNVGTKEWWEVL